MSIKIYNSEEIRERIEASNKFAGTTPLEASLEPDMAQFTLTTLGSILAKQMASQGAVGVQLIEVRFNLILDPDKVNSNRW